MLTEQDLSQISAMGITKEQVEKQLEEIKTGFPFLRIEAAASVEKGIMSPSDADKAAYEAAWTKYVGEGHHVVKFVPASGAASRMFKNMFAFLDAPYDVPTTDFEKHFFDNIKKFAFRKALCQKCKANEGMSVCELIKTAGSGPSE